MRSTSRAEREQETTETLRDEQRAIDGQRTGTARPFPLWRLPSGPYSPPIDSTFGSGISPQARIAAHLTLHSVVWFHRNVNMLLSCRAVWPACHIPLGKSLVCLDNWKVHNSA